MDSILIGGFSIWLEPNIYSPDDIRAYIITQMTLACFPYIVGTLVSLGSLVSSQMTPLKWH